NLHGKRSVCCIIRHIHSKIKSRAYQTETRCRSDSADQFSVPEERLPALLLHDNNFRDGLSNLVPKICSPKEASLGIQQYRITRVYFDYQIFHCLPPPFTGAICSRCPRMISYPLVNDSRIATRYFLWRSRVFLLTPDFSSILLIGSFPVLSISSRSSG